MRALLIGSSSFESAGAPLVAALRSALPGIDLVPAGRRGWSVRSWLSAWEVAAPPALSSLEPSDLVLVYLPGNALSSSEEIAALDAAVRASTRAAVSWLEAPMWPVPRTEEGALVERVRLALLSSGARVVMARRVQLVTGDLAGDGVHLNHAGARKVAAAWASRIAALASGGGGLSPIVVALLLFAAWRLLGSTGGIG